MLYQLGEACVQDENPTKKKTNRTPVLFYSPLSGNTEGLHRPFMATVSRCWMVGGPQVPPTLTTFHNHWWFHVHGFLHYPKSCKTQWWLEKTHNIHGTTVYICLPSGWGFMVFMWVDIPPPKLMFTTLFLFARCGRISCCPNKDADSVVFIHRRNTWLGYYTWATLLCFS